MGLARVCPKPDETEDGNALIMFLTALLGGISESYCLPRPCHSCEPSFQGTTLSFSRDISPHNRMTAETMTTPAYWGVAPLPRYCGGQRKRVA